MRKSNLMTICSDRLDHKHWRLQNLLTKRKTSVKIASRPTSENWPKIQLEIVQKWKHQACNQRNKLKRQLKTTIRNDWKQPRETRWDQCWATMDNQTTALTAMQNRWSALNGPINWRKQTKKTKHNPQKFSHQCTPKPVARKNDMKMRLSRSMKKLDRTPSLWATGACAYMGCSNSPNSWNWVPTRTLRQLFENLNSLAWTRCFFKQKHGTLSLHRPTNSMVMANYGRPQEPNALECDVAASATRPMIYTLSAGQPACVWLLKTNHLCRRSLPLFLLLSDVLKDTQKLLPSVRDTRTLPFVGSIEGTMAAWGRINQKTKEPESNGILRKKCHTLHPLFPKDVWTFKRWLNKFDRKLWRKTEPTGKIENTIAKYIDQRTKQNTTKLQERASRTCRS